MTTRVPCKWKSIPERTYLGKVCAICKGMVKVKDKEVCPFLRNLKTDPPVGHLVTADERYFWIQLQPRQEVPKRYFRPRSAGYHWIYGPNKFQKLRQG